MFTCRLKYEYDQCLPVHSFECDQFLPIDSDSSTTNVYLYTYKAVEYLAVDLIINPANVYKQAKA